MTLHEFKDGVWYQEPGCSVQYMRDGDNWYSREDSGSRRKTISSFEQRVALCTTFRPVATDPVDDAWKEFRDSPVSQGASLQKGFRAGWSAREARGTQIDAEAAYKWWCSPNNSCCTVLALLNRINAGEFRK